MSAWVIVGLGLVGANCVRLRCMAIEWVCICGCILDNVKPFAVDSLFVYWAVAVNCLVAISSAIETEEIPCVPTG